MTNWNVLDLSFIAIVSDDVEVRRYYSEVLGFRLTGETPNYAYLVAGPTAHVEVLSSHTRSASQQNPQAPAIGFDVDDVEGAHRDLELQRHWCSDWFRWESEHEVHRWFYTRDPASNTLLLIEKRDKTRPW